MLFCACFLAFVLVTNGLEDGDVPNQLTFDSVSNGLPFPLPTPRSFDLGIVHGPHCFEVAQEFNATDTSFLAKVHYNHCRKFTQAVYEYLIGTPDYAINPIVCEDIKSVAMDRSEDALTIPLQYDRYRDSIETPYSKSSPGKYARQLSKNFLYMISKEYRGEKFTAAEAEYMKQMHEPFAIRTAALGVYCIHGDEGLDSLMEKMARFL